MIAQLLEAKFVHQRTADLIELLDGHAAHPEEGGQASPVPAEDLRAAADILRISLGKSSIFGAAMESRTRGCPAIPTWRSRAVGARGVLPQGRGGRERGCQGTGRGRAAGHHRREPKAAMDSRSRDSRIPGGNGTIRLVGVGSVLCGCDGDQDGQGKASVPGSARTTVALL